MEKLRVYIAQTFHQTFKYNSQKARGMAIDYEERAKGVILSLLVCNKGKWLSASEISSFIQENELKLGRFGDSLTPKRVGMLLNSRSFEHLRTERLKNKNKRYRYD